MKIRLLLACFAVMMASCSNDDNSGNDNPGENTEKKLREIVQTEFTESGDVATTYKISFDDDDRPLSELQYDGGGELVSKRLFVYNNGGQVESMNYYTITSGVETPNYSYTVAYDSANRVTEVNDSFIINDESASSVMTYLYNPDGTILMTRDMSVGGSTSILYYTNAAGQVYKKTTSSGGIEELVYTGNNVLNYSYEGGSSAFEYDNEHLPKGQHHNTIVNQYNGNITNTMLLGGFMAIGLGKDKYAIKRTDSNGNVFDYEYQFDAEGYPVKLRYFRNDANIPSSIREIYYK